MALIGLSGAGKTTVAPLVAARLGFPWLDLDQQIERAAGKPIASLFAEGTEAEFRALEAAALEDALATKGPGLVLSCGGGVVTTPATRSRLRARAFVVWLRVSLAEAMARLGTEGAASRPLLRGAAGGNAPAALEAMLRERGPLYEGAADAVVDTNGRTPGEVADRVAALCRADPTWP